MCTIDPSLCWYYDYQSFWHENPALFKLAFAWHTVLGNADAAKYRYIRDQIAAGTIKAHRLNPVIGRDGVYVRYSCWREGWERSSGPVPKDRMCTTCDTSIDS